MYTLWGIVLIPGAEAFLCFSKMVWKSSQERAKLEETFFKGGCGGSPSNSPKGISLKLHLEEMGITFLRIGSCFLHPTHAVFWKDMKKFYGGKINAKESQHFDLNDFFSDIHFFFKLLSA